MTAAKNLWVMHLLDKNGKVIASAIRDDEQRLKMSSDWVTAERIEYRN